MAFLEIPSKGSIGLRQGLLHVFASLSSNAITNHNVHVHVLRVASACLSLSVMSWNSLALVYMTTCVLVYF
jgi:hypothetical protein